MRDVSKYSTFALTYAVRRMEVRSRVSLFFGYEEANLAGADLIGFGASHAFGSVTGRFRFVESLAAPDGSKDEGGLYNPGEIWEKFKLAGLNSEWKQLVGTPELLDHVGIDRTPEHRIGTSYRWEELGLRELLREDAKIYNRLRDLVIAQEIESLLDEIHEICFELGCDPHLLFIREHMPSPQALHAFVDGLPSANTWARLRELKHRDFSLPWDQQDWTDLVSLSVAFPYLDAVVTEKRWAHLFAVSGLVKKYKTCVGSGIKALENILENAS